MTESPGQRQPPDPQPFRMGPSTPLYLSKDDEPRITPLIKTWYIEIRRPTGIEIRVSIDDPTEPEVVAFFTLAREVLLR